MRRCASPPVELSARSSTMLLLELPPVQFHSLDGCVSARDVGWRLCRRLRRGRAAAILVYHGHGAVCMGDVREVAGASVPRADVGDACGNDGKGFGTAERLLGRNCVCSFLVVAEATLVLSRRDLWTVTMFVGMFANEMLNIVSKIFLHEPRPPGMCCLER